jgi:hypothetical protein
MSKNTPTTVALDALLEELSKFPAKDGKYTYDDIVYAASVISRLPKPKKTSKPKDSTSSSDSEDSKTSSDVPKMTWNEFKKKRNADLKDTIKDATERAEAISEEWKSYKESIGINTKPKTAKKSKSDDAKVETKVTAKVPAKAETKAETKVETKVAELKAIDNDVSDDEAVSSDDEFVDEE